MPARPSTKHEPVIVEVGGGPGGRHRSDSGRQTIGVDIDLRAIRSSRPGPASSVDVCADAMDLPFRSGSCDQLVLRAVLHHLVPTDGALRELARVLRPGGRLRIVDGVALEANEAARLHSELRAAGLATEPIYGFDLGELTTAIRAVGLEVDDLRIDGVATFATPPFVSRAYSSDRFTVVARRP